MTGVNIIHTRQAPSIHRKAIRTVTLKAVEIETDPRLVPQVPLIPVTQPFRHDLTGQNPTVDPERAVKEVPASLQVKRTVIMPFQTATRMAVIAIASPIMLSVTRLFLGLSTPVLQEKCITITVKQRSPSGRSQKSGLSEREERKREKKGKNGMWLEQRMDVMGEEILPSIENTWSPRNQVNTCHLQRVYTEIITTLAKSEMATTLSLETPSMIRESVRMIEDIRWSRHVQYTLLLFPQLFTGLLLLQQMLEEKQWFHLQEAYKMFHLQPRHHHAPICTSTLHTLPHQI